ncbi:response regulator transcription factor [Anaeromicrobium sediminis]|uniref:Stage 0 sporulation protein A homolog n=1 Tax=Anaeromicrobium sediminis TaxID=1478221 RepID=A0A267MCD7_9FIRM|nr:response regulator transcription factor [Anaeromicrobium sediminis]PAB57241.1 DNA-binding response regulator [Anaeromicrobium sediminis]
MIKILIAEDEDKMRQVIRKYVEKEEYEVTEACDGRAALEILETENDFSLIILDVMMPIIDGWTVCRKVREKLDTPIIMLTARGEEYDRLFGFELGVDDYIVKPFSPRELIARIKAILKRSSKTVKNDVLDYGNIKISPLERIVLVDNKEVYLTPKEFDLLLFLTTNNKQACSREMLLSKVWGYDFIGDLRTVDTHIKQLREKLSPYKGYIKTVWGTGYKFKVEE